MSPPGNQLREDALAIWRASVDAVRSDRLVLETVRAQDGRLTVGDLQIPLAEIERIAVVGCGKAGTGMAAGLEAALGDRLLEEKKVHGWVNVPDDCVKQLKHVHLHGSRPAGVNEPTEQGVQGARHVLDIVRSLGPKDVCFCLISGGGSALLPAPVEGITLTDKLNVTRHLSGAGANIQQLNTVRKQLSSIKGGRLAQACTAGHLITLIISDVLGDPLDVIASGPTVADPSTPQQALDVLSEFDAREAGISDRVFDYLSSQSSSPTRQSSCRVTNLIIGNNATAVKGADREALRRGYVVQTKAVQQLEGEAEDIGRQLLGWAQSMRSGSGRNCLISGGEPTVRLIDSNQRGRGGRNQQLVLAALARLTSDCEHSHEGIVLLSGGTDGEDGPTDAAGAFFDNDIITAMRAANLAPDDYLRRNDAYTFFEPLGALIHTGPTHTNVCDVRVVLTDGRQGE
jgi:hydroxypyruvate reductase